MTIKKLIKILKYNWKNLLIINTIIQIIYWIDKIEIPFKEISREQLLNYILYTFMGLIILGLGTIITNKKKIKWLIINFLVGILSVSAMIFFIIGMVIIFEFVYPYLLKIMNKELLFSFLIFLGFNSFLIMKIWIDE